MSNILTGFNMQGNDPIDNRIVSPSKFETLEEYLQRVPIQKRYYGLSFYALDENNELRHYTFQTSLKEPTIDDDEEEIERLDKELQEHVNNKEIHKTSEEIRSEIVDADIPDTIARVQWTLDKIEEAVNTVMGDIVDGASDEYNTLKKIQDKIVELRTEVESQLYGDDGGEVLKTLEQALKFLNQYKDFIVDIPDNYVNKQDIVDNLNTDDPTKVLSARQGKVLSETLTNYFDSAMASIRAETNRATNAENRIEAKLDSEIDRSTAEDIRIQSELDAEEARAQSEEQRIEDKLDAEIERSTTKDTELGNQIIAETNRAKGEEQRIETKLDNEITRSTAKDADHDSRIEALEGETHIQNTDIGTTSQTFQLQMGKPGNKIKNEDAAVSVRNATDTDYVNFIAKNATFKGDLLVEGQSFVTEAETVEIKDNLLLLNKGEVGAGVTKGIAGLEIDRGTEPNYFIIFDESDNRFKAGVEGDLWNLALRESDDNMLDGYFISWNSKDKILSTTNIVNESTPLLFGRTDYKQYSGNRTDPDGNYSSYAFISEAEGNHLYNFSGSSNWNIDTDKINFRFWKPLLGTTFKRASDNSEVLYHADIVNNLTSGGTNKVLSAEQGKLLQNSITSIQGSYLPLSGGTMEGNIRFPIGNGIVCNDVAGTAAYVVLRTWNYNDSTRMYVGTVNFPTYISSTASDLIHDRNGSSYLLWDSYNLPTPASTTDLNNYLPLVGGTLTGQLTIKQSVDIKLRLQSTDADNHCIIQAINSQASQLGAFGYAGDKWAIGHGGTYYEIWDKYNLTNPVTYTTNTYNHATLTNKDGQYFTYIKAGTNGLLPHSGATLTSGGSGSLGTSDQSFNAAYINNLHTNKITFGETGPYITGSTSATQFLNAEGGSQKVATGSLYVGPSYASDALNLVPANGIYSRGIIYIENGIGFRNSIWTNDLTPNRNYSGYLQVLDAYDASSAGGPTNYGTVLQVNSRNAYWANQLWFPGGAEASKNGLYYRHMAYNQTEYGEWHRLLTNKDVNIITTQSTSNPTTLPVNQIFYSEIKGVDGTPTVMGALFSVQGDDEGIQLWASSSKTELYYRTKWTSFGNWIKLATTSDLVNYLPLTGGKLSGQLTVEYAGSTPLIVNNSHTNGVDSILNFKVKGVNKALVGYSNGNGPFIQDASSNRCIMVKSDGAYFGTELGAGTKLALITDIPSASGYATQSWVNTQLGSYVAKSGSTMTGALTMNNRRENVVVDVVGGAGQSWNEGAGALSVQVPSDSGQTPLLLARRSGAAIDTTTAAERLLSMELSNTGNTFRITLSNTSTFQLDLSTAKGFLFGKTIATTDQIPSIPSISISNSGSGNAVTSITASGHTLTVTKGATYLTSSSLDGYATQTWVNNKGYLTSHQTIYNLTFQAGTFAAKTFDPNGAAATVNIPTKTSHITNDSGFITSSALSGYATQSWVTSQGYLTSSSLSGYATQTWVNNKNYAVRESDNVLISHSNEFNFTASSNTSIAINYRGGSGSKTSAAITEYRFYNGQGSYSNVNILANSFTGSLIGNASSATKLGSSTVGGTAKPIYLSSGTPTACSATVGSTTVPVYMNAGTITQCSTTLGVSITGNAATATNATQLGGTAASSYVKANDNISRLTNDRNYVRSTSTLKVADIQVLDGGTPGSEAGILYIVLE